MADAVSPKAKLTFYSFSQLYVNRVQVSIELFYTVAAA